MMLNLIERIIFVLNENPSPTLWNQSEINPKSIENYEILIQRLLSIDLKQNTPKTIEFSNEAKSCIINWQNQKRNTLKIHKVTCLTSKTLFC